MTESGRFFYINKGFEVFKDYPVAGLDSVHSAGLQHCHMDRQSISIMESVQISTAESISTRIISTFK